MPLERPPKTSADPGRTTLEELKVYSPPRESIRESYPVKPGETLSDVAKRAGYKDGQFWYYIDYVFPGCDKNPECVNWYLNYRYNCPATRDGKNRQFKGGEKLPLPNGEWLYGAPKTPAVRPNLYNRQAAARYARDWAIAINPAYPEFHDDCTNFVSQCLLAGGWRMIGGTVWDYNNDDVWWYGKVGKDDYDGVLNNVVDGIKDRLGYDRGGSRDVIYRASHTWAGAPALATFMRRSGRAFQRASYRELEAGDVIQEYDSAQSRIVHTMIVTARFGQELEYAQHTDRAIRRFIERFPTGNHPDYPKKHFIFWKVKDLLD